MILPVKTQCRRHRRVMEVILLKQKQMRITDIAALYQVPPSHVGAWISRSLEKLRNDPDFLTCLL